MRLRFNKNAETSLMASPMTFKDFPIDNKKNTILEIGMGRGTMLTKLALMHPDIEYIGLEKYSTPAYSALKKAIDLNLENFHIIIGDAINLSTYFKNKIKTIWLTFSDPWPKKRHYKRRLVYRDFLKIYQNVLDKDGVVYFKTDNDMLYQFAIDELKEINAKIIYQTSDLHHCNFKIENVFTDYEEKFNKLNKNINFIAFTFN
ncbi:tRNA (guanosine(46)-N7)-methyltransferase TrmB [Metamycoplasma hominis]|uniref:tRNA (guanine-N(7)-)-methyltransferase n=1 Tax=Metamycoplasma hominis (strain ATCC 23114 / DSM 25592 / NBRC 14850 / NCTC 10111 / PG21) TaxID=347256 RepID=TRMB_METH1|nr:tRNA (guanosine(46)-N7)-methyltransferase TrmB [Metamycoplasma hominis]Q9F411.1 RecName: Full=tRNA (guanine-N(7)-)-methyltransferase; AltName: Full=tRNA (guanine(46)-N(7))-methyltransferase; AltName: Full=tRNA(m7G46)-methyltransferase [Metamycoplasma hominis ATCC 23114]AAG28841.1 MG347-like protein [Metamycoplasma hominis ATCC 23114]OKL23369.1 tRNA (guanosine(46)-N7)-methyltransferase TrmB [Metamycoplasma hominis]CAX37560.1 tRNA (guanine-N(7)-)-methyltransferase [Metamycoplasma hominis ATCC 